MDHQSGDNKGNVNFRAGDDSGVKYTDETSWRAMRYYREPQSPKVIQWVMKYSGGLIKDEKQANYVLIGFAVLAIIISFSLFLGGDGGSGSIPANIRNSQPPWLKDQLK